MDNNKGQTLIDPTGYDTPEEAMEEYLSYSKVFKEQMQKLKDQQVSKKDFRTELTSWYHNSSLPLCSGSTVITTSWQNGFIGILMKLMKNPGTSSKESTILQKRDRKLENAGQNPV